VLEKAMSDIVKEVGFKIIVLREQRGWTQERLASEAGLHRAYIGQIERGEKNIGLKNLEKIANALNVSVRVLLDVPNP
jgi:transcriptional regulator with XRE-family HTH domain